MTLSVINISDAPSRSDRSGKCFQYSITELASRLGAKAIGANITRVPPGKAAFPFHHHYGNEEHFFVLSGFGVVRLGGELHDVKADDYIVNLPGGAERAHQLINTGTEDLVYLAISTSVTPEVVGYPDSAKTGVRPSSLDGEGSRFLIADNAKDSLSYWDGEDGGRVAEVVARRK